MTLTIDRRRFNRAARDVARRHRGADRAAMGADEEAQHHHWPHRNHLAGSSAARRRARRRRAGRRATCGASGIRRAPDNLGAGRAGAPAVQTRPPRGRAASAGPRDERGDLQGCLGAGFSGLELFDWQINGLESQGVLGRLRREVQAAADLELHEHQPDRSGAARRYDCRGRRRRQDPEEVRRQDDRHRTERPCRRRKLQLQRSQAEHRHDAQRARQGHHRHRPDRRAASAHRHGGRNARRDLRDDGGGRHART